MMASGGDGPRDAAVRVTRTRGVRRDVWAVVAIGLGIVAVLLALRSGAQPPRPAEPVATAPPPAPASAPPAADATPDSGAAAVPATMPRSRAGKLRALRALGVTPERGPEGKRQLDAAPVIEALKGAGSREGIAAFGTPGTDPPKSGVVVPDGWELPEGYVRHHQSTDDGEQLPPILMFHPDYTFSDEHGNPIEVPPDRVVPPELVPPGFPVERLDVPPRRTAR